jgi:pimeloyl-ACP methyl ester carboxylesterase
VFAPDSPGYGQSDKPKIEYSTEYYLGFLGHLMDALGVEKANLVGISMGGAISLGFSLRSPRRVEKLVLVDSHGLGGEVPGGVASFALVRLPLLNRLMWTALGRSRRMLEWSLRSVFYDPRAVTRDLVDEVFELAKKPGSGQAWRSWQRNEIRWGAPHQLRRQASRSSGAYVDTPRGGRQVRTGRVGTKSPHLDQRLGTEGLLAVRTLAHLREAGRVQQGVVRVLGKTVNATGSQGEQLTMNSPSVKTRELL